MLTLSPRIVDYDSDYEPAKGDSGQGASTADPYAGKSPSNV